ncbi:MAG: YbhN family protein [Acidimicrobiaceae bacterium]
MNGAPKRRRSSGLRSTFRWAKWPIFLLVFWLFILPIVPGFGDALSKLGEVQTSWLLIGIALEFAALFCYSMLTHVALGQDAEKVSVLTLFRIQLSTRSLGSLVPGGSAASNALGFRLMTLAGANGRDAGFALATAGVGSAVVLNLILWVALIVSIPGRGVNAFYGTAAIFGVIVMLLAGGIVLGLIDHEGRAERVTRSIAKRFRFDPDKAGEVAVHLGDRLRGLANEQGLLRRVCMWSLLNWGLDIAALFVFIRAFDGSVDVVGLVISFCLANVFASIPITPGGLGIVEGIYIPSLVGFGLSTATATVSVLSYRLVQFWLPMLVGGVCYLSLRVGKFALQQAGELKSLQRYAVAGNKTRTSRYEWAERNATTDRTREIPLPKYDPRYGLADTDELPITPTIRDSRKDSREDRRPGN